MKTHHGKHNFALRCPNETLMIKGSHKPAQLHYNNSRSFIVPEKKPTQV